MTTQFITNHLWQSSCLVPLAALAAFILRENAAKVRYWVWLGASLKFLVPFALLVGLGSVIPQRGRHAVAAPASAFPNTLLEIAQPFSPTSYAAVPAHVPLPWVPAAIGVLWALGFFAVTLARCRSWFRIRATLRASTPVELPIPVPAFVSSGVEEPGVVGFLRPILVLPAQILEHLNPRQLHAVLAHELCHVRRRDNFFAAIHMVVEAVFWFHPLVWWIGSRMVEERELACDEEVMRTGCEPADYVEGILKVCRFYTESALPCVSGVTGADVKKRLRAILAGSTARELQVGKKVALTVVALGTLAAPIVIGVINASRIHAQAQVLAAIPKWEAASIKPCKPGDAPAGRGGGGGGRGASDPGLLRFACTTPDRLIRFAYLLHASGKHEPGPSTVSQRIMNQNIAGEPGWAKSEPYTVEAKPETPQILEMMRGPMLQTLLEERFNLKIHSEDMEVPVYALLVGKGGPKLTASREGSCISLDLFDPMAQPSSGQRPPCGPFGPDAAGGIVTYGSTLASLCRQFSVAMDRDVIDKTDLTGQFDIHLQLTEQELFSGMPPSDAAGAGIAPDPSDPTSAIMAAVQKLGLRLEPAKAIVPHLVIDHIERPSEN